MKMCRRCRGSGQEPKGPDIIPIAWRTCRYCEKRYDEGNPFAAFAHRNRECSPRTSPDSAVSAEDTA